MCIPLSLDAFRAVQGAVSEADNAREASTAIIYGAVATYFPCQRWVHASPTRRSTVQYGPHFDFVSPISADHAVICRHELRFSCDFIFYQNASLLGVKKAKYMIIRNCHTFS